jgi:hypothetical protein
LVVPGTIAIAFIIDSFYISIEYYIYRILKFLRRPIWDLGFNTSLLYPDLYPDLLEG